MSDRLRLADLDPEGVARAACARVVDHLHQTALQLDHSLVLAIPQDAGGLGLRATLHALVLYAQRGCPVWDWADDGMAADGLLDALAALYGSPCGGLDGTAVDVVDDIDPDDAIGLVLVAAAARIRLSQGSAVTARELGALSGIGAHGLRRYIRSGELPTDGGRPARVAAEDAVRWLEARGVPMGQHRE